MGRWRTMVLIGVHVVILAHIFHWLWAGSTLSPVEPSEAMYTLSEGELNAGFIFFALALLSTVIFGRVFCGWGCHVVALQDGSSWLLKKIGLRPSPFRSRLLLWFPLILAFYMFLWPKTKRYVAAPILERTWPEGLAYIGATPTWTQLSNAFIVEDYWSTFPPWYVAIPFLFVIGFGVVYFLGAKGFCTYACPYGGFFAPLDKVSPMRIVVDHDKCAECGVCTAVCTSNVRVSEEIKDHGMVVDPGCMKCMDCVSACPSDALSYKAVLPPMLATNPRDPDPATEGKRKKKPKTSATKVKWDLSWPEEIGLAAFFVITFVSLRGLYGVIPMLLAGALAVIATWFAWKAWLAIRKANARIHSMQLKRRGRFTLWGGAYLGAVGVMTLFIAHSAWLSWHWAGGLLALNRVALVSAEAPDAGEQRRDLYEQAVQRFERVHEIGFWSTPKTDFQLALALARLNRPAEGETAMRRAIEREGVKDGLAVDLAELISRQGRAIEAMTYLESVLQEHPRFEQSRWSLGALYMQAGRVDDAVELYREGVAARPRDHESYAKLAEALAATGDFQAMIAPLEKAVELLPDAPGYRRDLALATLYAGKPGEAVRLMANAAEVAEGDQRVSLFSEAASLAMQAGQPERARELRERAQEAETSMDRE
jgi:tetratricopeptide (TPR) repeat protein/ferredoxin